MNRYKDRPRLDRREGRQRAWEFKQQGWKQATIAALGVTPGAWQAPVEAVFRLWTTSLGDTFGDLRAVAVPSLVLVGDCDGACTVEHAVTTYRALPEAELCVLPHLHHAITRQPADVTLAFLLRHRAI